MGLEAEELAEPSDVLFDILATVAPSKLALAVHEGVVKLVKAQCRPRPVSAAHL